MKKLFLLVALGLISIAAKSNEMHTPQYKCTSAIGGDLYIMVGNDFPQIPDLDWSNEIKISTPSQALHCEETKIDNIFTLQAFDNGDFIQFDSFLSEPKTISTSLGNEVNLTVELIDGKSMHFIYSKKGCNKGIHCQDIITYQCVKQLGVDSSEKCAE